MQPPAATLRRQQGRFDAFCREYNEERAHEGLGLATPAEVYRPSRRSYPERVTRPEYNDTWQVRKVQDGGHLRWFCDRVFVSHALTGKYVGFEPAGEQLWRVWFYRQWLGIWEPRQRRLWRPTEIRRSAGGQAALSTLL